MTYIYMHIYQSSILNNSIDIQNKEEIFHLEIIETIFSQQPANLLTYETDKYLIDKINTTQFNLNICGLELSNVYLNTHNIKNVFTDLYLLETNQKQQNTLTSSEILQYTISFMTKCIPIILKTITEEINKNAQKHIYVGFSTAGIFFYYQEINWNNYSLNTLSTEEMIKIGNQQEDANIMQKLNLKSTISHQLYYEQLTKISAFYTPISIKYIHILFIFNDPKEEGWGNILTNTTGITAIIICGIFAISYNSDEEVKHENNDNTEIIQLTELIYN